MTSALWELHIDAACVYTRVEFAILNLGVVLEGIRGIERRGRRKHEGQF